MMRYSLSLILLFLYFLPVNAGEVNNNPIMEVHIISLSKDIHEHIFLADSVKDENIRIYIDEKLSGKIEDFMFYLPNIKNTEVIHTLCSAHHKMSKDFIEIAKNCTLERLNHACGNFVEISNFCNKNEIKPNNELK